MKHDAMIDPDWGAAGIPGLKPFVAKIPGGRLFTGETDGSSFPNGGLRVTHQAAAFTSWDRGSPPFIYEGTCYIPCAFVSHYGACLDDKTPLLRAQDAVNREGLRLLKNVGGYEDVKQVVSYLGWEQEFFVVSKEAYLARPDLRACGRTLMGAAPQRGQQMDLNYFAAMPPAVKACMDEVQAELLKIGCPLNVYHNEVAPAQHEISPFFTVTNISSDLNQIAMQICCEVAAKHDLVMLFHEKPFAGINGSGKHNNWSVGTDTGVNFFHPGKTEKQSALFSTALACLTYALNQHNVVIRNSVAHAGNDHRLGAQEAPPAIISLYPGTTFEAKVADIVAGGGLSGYFSGGTMLDARCANLNEIERGLEDRNRTAPFPFCGNRFEFRAVGSSQSCAFPMAMVDTCFADGMRALSELIEVREGSQPLWLFLPPLPCLGRGGFFILLLLLILFLLLIIVTINIIITISSDPSCGAPLWRLPFSHSPRCRSPCRAGPRCGTPWRSCSRKTSASFSRATATAPSGPLRRRSAGCPTSARPCQRPWPSPRPSPRASSRAWASCPRPRWTHGRRSCSRTTPR